jgi:hypothetical protein
MIVVKYIISQLGKRSFIYNTSIKFNVECDLLPQLGNWHSVIDGGEGQNDDGEANTIFESIGTILNELNL